MGYPTDQDFERARSEPRPLTQEQLLARRDEDIRLALQALQEQIHNTAREKGFWDTPRNEGEIIALHHSELSEALEAMRAGNPPDDKIPEFSGVEAELADVIIRIMDHAEGFGHDVIGALLAKTKMNKTRERMNGGKKF